MALGPKPALRFRAPARRSNERSEAKAGTRVQGRSPGVGIAKGARAERPWPGYGWETHDEIASIKITFKSKPTLTGRSL